MKQRAIYLSAFFSVLFLLLSPSIWAQLTIGQYEEEAPFRTWNTYGIQTAPALGRGGAQFAVVSDASATVINPALLISLPRASFTVNGFYQTASLNKYSLVNTGVLYTQDNSSMSTFGADFLGFSFSFNGWAVGFSAGLMESYDRPPQNPSYEYQSQVLYSIDFEQDGLLRNYNLSLAKKFGGWLSVGIGANYVSGSMQRRIIENYFYNGITITDEKSQDFNGFYINGGIVVEVVEKLNLAAVFRTPYTKGADGSSLLRFDSSLGNTEINIEASARNSFKQPLILGTGMSFDISTVLAIALDVSYFDWSTYTVEYFEEKLARNFRDIIKIAGGIEYQGGLRLFQQDCELPVRIGVCFDPQPMKSPASSYFYYTFGLGLHWKGIHLDAGAMLGAERGSGDHLMGRKFSLSLSYLL